MAPDLKNKSLSRSATDTTFVPLGSWVKFDDLVALEGVERVPAITELRLNDECKLRFDRPVDDAIRITVIPRPFQPAFQVTLIAMDRPRLDSGELSARS